MGDSDAIQFAGVKKLSGKGPVGDEMVSAIDQQFALGKKIVIERTFALYFIINQKRGGGGGGILWALDF